jgi:phage regulator Rha-like protein
MARMKGRTALAKTHDSNQEVTEFDNLKSHFATSSAGWGGRRSFPCAFTEHGAIMAASVLNTAKAIEVTVYVVRAFVRIREYLATHKQLAQKLAELERKIGTHDQAIQSLMDAIHRLMAPLAHKRHQIGFHAEKAKQ